MLSILIPTYNYNVLPLVEKLKALSQSFNHDYEINVVDDASPHKSIAKTNSQIQNWENCNYFHLEKNKGRTYSRHYLAKHASFDNLLFLDADVMPYREDFFELYTNEIGKATVTCGGITYGEKQPDKSLMLRWKYGRNREARNAVQRRKHPYLSFISGAFLIKKDRFLALNLELENRYGMDSVFAYQLAKNQISIEHIENPVVHLGLETNEAYLLKTQLGLKTLLTLERNSLVPKDFRPLQKIRNRLMKNSIDRLFLAFMNSLDATIQKNLRSGKPSLILFDLYRLKILLELQNEMDA